VNRKKLALTIALVGVLTLLMGAWLISRLNSTPAPTAGAHYATYSGYAPATTTPTPAPSPTARPPTPPPSHGSGPGNPSGSAAIAQAVFQAINNSRAAAGLPALQWSAALAGGAHQHNLRMAAADQLSHQLPGEPAIGTRITQDGIHWTWCGENIGYTSQNTTSGALGLHQMMMAEQPPNDGHRKNILSTNFTMVGVDILIDSNHRLWLTEDFAN
jgi:uncharacterized protein YkwD